jgi:penicillin-binding protein 2
VRTAQPFVEALEMPDVLLPSRPGVHPRLLLFYVLVVALFARFAWRIVYLQTSQGTAYQTMADDNRFRTIRTTAPRGIIYDRSGLPLVRNVPGYNVSIIPAHVPDDESQAREVYDLLSGITQVPVTTTVSLDPSPQSKLRFQGPGVHDLSEPSPLYLVPIQHHGISETVELASTFEPYQPVLIKADVGRTTAQIIEELRPWLPGVEVQVVPVREYPAGPLMSHIIGYMGPLPDDSWLDLGYEKIDRVGYTGVEITMEAELSGTKGERQIEVDVAGKPLRVVGPVKEPVAGLNVHLTIDSRLQAAASYALTNTIAAIDRLWGIKLEQGAVVAIDPRSGEILAMVSIPTYDSNRFSTRIDLDYYYALLENTYNPLVNHAITGQFPPGSTFKLVTASGALQEGVITRHTVIVGEGIVHLKNKYAPNDPGQAQPFYCWNREGHGPLTILGGLGQSCNIFFYKIGGGFPDQHLEGLGEERLARYAEQFGFGSVTGIELIGEASGHVPTARWKRLTYGESWSTGDTYNMATGQGFVTATPLQVLNMAAAVAAGGTLYRPTIVHHFTDAAGNVVRVADDGTVTPFTDAEGNLLPAPQTLEQMDRVFEPEVAGWLEVSPENLALVQEGMRRAVTEGTAEYASLDEYGIHVAGKTGTAEFCDDLAIRRGWCREGWPLPTHAWFTAYAPYEDPEIAVVAFVYNGGEGSAVAVPIVYQFLEAYFQVGRRAPSDSPGGA